MDELVIYCVKVKSLGCRQQNSGLIELNANAAHSTISGEIHFWQMYESFKLTLTPSIGIIYFLLFGHLNLRYEIHSSHLCCLTSKVET